MPNRYTGSSNCTPWINDLNWKCALEKENKFQYKINDLLTRRERPHTPDTAVEEEITITLPTRAKMQPPRATTCGHCLFPERKETLARVKARTQADPGRLAKQGVWRPGVGLGTSMVNDADQLRMQRRGVRRIHHTNGAGFSQTMGAEAAANETRQTHGFPWFERPHDEAWRKQSAERAYKGRVTHGIPEDVVSFLDKADFFATVKHITGAGVNLSKAATKQVQRKMRALRRGDDSLNYTLSRQPS